MGEGWRLGAPRVRGAARRGAASSRGAVAASIRLGPPASADARETHLRLGGLLLAEKVAGDELRDLGCDLRVEVAAARSRGGIRVSELGLRKGQKCPGSHSEGSSEGTDPTISVQSGAISCSCEFLFGQMEIVGNKQR